MSKIFKPRRGKASTMNGTKSSTVLAAGEMFIELPDTGVGTGVCKMKMGDGVTAYGSLPYAMGGDIATTEITGNINDDTSSTATAALANVTTGKTLGSIIGSLRRACSLNAQAIATLNDDLDRKDIIARTTNKSLQGLEISSFNGVTTTMSVQAVSNYSILCNAHIYSTGIVGMIANFDNDTLLNTTTPNIYLYNASNRQLIASHTAYCHIYTLYKRT
jgi:hypothetical protein